MAREPRKKKQVYFASVTSDPESNIYCKRIIELYTQRMEESSLSRRIADIATVQWGMSTTAQARMHGVARANLAHRVRTGTLERTDHYRVYRLVAVPTSPLDDLRAAWLSTNPQSLGPQRTAAPRPDAVVTSSSAATVHGIGDVYPAPYRFIVPSRRQSTTDAIAYSWRPLDAIDIEIIDGLPVTSRERTIVDLLADEGDASITADALRESLRDRYDLDETRLAELLAPHATRLGRSPGDGMGALKCLIVTAGMDAASEGHRAVDRILQSETPLSGVEAILRQLVENVPALAGSVPATAPAPSFAGGGTSPAVI